MSARGSEPLFNNQARYDFIGIHVAIAKQVWHRAWPEGKSSLEQTHVRRAQSTKSIAAWPFEIAPLHKQKAEQSTPRSTVASEECCATTRLGMDFASMMALTPREISGTTSRNNARQSSASAQSASSRCCSQDIPPCLLPGQDGPASLFPLFLDFI